MEKNLNINPYSICSHSPKKIEARFDTLVIPYQTLAGRRKLPKEKQHWTFAAECSDGNGKILPDSELGQLTACGLITPEQFFGVEINEGTYQRNSTIKGPTWLYGDFGIKMVEWSNHNYFNPGIINVDDIHMPRRGISYLSRILALLVDLNVRDVLVVCNNVLKAMSRKSNFIEMPQRLLLNRLFDEKEWSIHEQIYEYSGSNNKSDHYTKMGTMWIYR